MSASGNKLQLNDIECEYDIYGDTRNGYKHNEEKKYSKHSYSYKDTYRIEYSKNKKEIQREKCKENLEYDNQEYENVKKNKKREIKQIDEEDENQGNNYEKINGKPKQKKLPKKGRFRF